MGTGARIEVRNSPSSLTETSINAERAHLLMLAPTHWDRNLQTGTHLLVGLNRTPRCMCVDAWLFFPSHVGCYRGCYGIYSAVARTLPLNISSLPSHWPASMMQDSLAPNLSRAPIETCQSAFPLLFPAFCLSIIVSSPFSSFATSCHLKVENLDSIHTSFIFTHLTVCPTHGVWRNGRLERMRCKSSRLRSSCLQLLALLLLLEPTGVRCPSSMFAAPVEKVRMRPMTVCRPRRVAFAWKRAAVFPLEEKFHVFL